MIKLVITGRCAVGKSREAALRHMRAVHGPMVYAPPPDAGAMPSHYAQNPAIDDGGVLPESWRSDRNFVTEIGFADVAHLKAATSTPYYLETLRSDESNFVDQTSVGAVLTRPELRSADHGAEAARLFVFLKLRGDAFASESAAAFNELEADSAVIARARDGALPAPDGRQPAFDLIERLSFATHESAYDFARRRFAALADRLAPWIEPRLSFAVFADPHSVERLKQRNRQETGDV